MKDILITKDSKGKVRVLNFECVRTETDAGDLYIIHRSSGQLNGKITQQPDLEISKGKVKRTTQQQAELEYNSLIKKALDKGYKNITSFGFTNLSDFDPNKVLGDNKTDQKGIGKPMFCNVLDKTKSRQTNKHWLASYKHDGVRCLIYIDENGIIKTSSRGGENYDIAATYITNDPYIQKILHTDSNIVLDGEIYRHGWPLSKISGLCRLKSLTDEHKELKFHCYDIADPNKEFKRRCATLGQFKQITPSDSRLVIVDHIPVQGLDQIMKFHDLAISEGYEGAVLRDPDGLYKFGGRDNRMLKVKLFSDDEFKVTGLSEGLRDEDMCFTLVTKEGYPFKAKPVGDRALKQWYREHINELIGQMATVKYFGFTTTNQPVPNLPVLKSFRIKEDI